MGLIKLKLLSVTFWQSRGCFIVKYTHLDMKPIFSCGATQYMVLCVCVWVRMLSVRPVSPDLQNCIHQTYASANLLLAMLWFGLFASCRGLESPIHFKRFCYCDWRRLDWQSTQNASRSVCPWVLYSATSATRVVIFFLQLLFSIFSWFWILMNKIKFV